MNSAGMGFDGEVAERVESRPKPVGGTVPYLSNLLACLISYRNKHAVVTYDGQRLEGTFNSVIAANGGYFGGGMFIAPNASATDGLFDLVLLGDLSKPEVVANLPGLYKGTHIRHPKVTVLRAREITVESRERGLVQADGEVAGMSPATFRIIPGGVRIIV
jgi:diacylglycerol kinase family enzyme